MVLPGAFPKGQSFKVKIDEVEVCADCKLGDQPLYFTKNEKWSATEKPAVTQRGSHRNGTFKAAFNHRMVFVYGTVGTKEENEWAYNKARYDAETWYYRGNGAVDVITDKEFSLTAYADRGVVLFGKIIEESGSNFGCFHDQIVVSQKQPKEKLVSKVL